MTTATATTTTLAAALAAAVRSVGDLAPDRVNQQERFAYRSADLILSRCGQALAAQGVVVVPSVREVETAVGETAKGMKRYEAFVTMEFIVTNGNEQLVVPWRTAGVDFSSPDRALAKAVTLGHKYFLAKLLAVGVGNEDAEAESEPEPRPRPPVLAAQEAQPHRPRPAEAEFSSPAQAIAWAVEIGANENEHAARAAFRRLVETEFGGRLTLQNAGDVYRRWREDRLAKLKRAEGADESSV